MGIIDGRSVLWHWHSSLRPWWSTFAREESARWTKHGAAKTEAEDRSLTDEGQRAVERTADFLAALRLPLDRIEHSEKLRRAKQQKSWPHGSGQPKEQGKSQA